MSKSKKKENIAKQWRRSHDLPDLPESILNTYSRLWQLETWLRSIVYVQLRALLGDSWETEVKVDKTEWSKKADKNLIHMPTSEDYSLSYAQLSELLRIIRNNRKLFDPFLPPGKIWDARMDEISQVRHRVAHFRRVNKNDLDRVLSLLRDIDKGFWKFCTSFNDAHPVLPQIDDPVTKHFLHLDLLPWGEVEEGRWARVGSISRDAWFGVTVETTFQPWAKKGKPVAGLEGAFYDVNILLRGARGRYFDLRNFLENTRKLHKHFVYICPSNRADLIRLVIPAVLGEERIIEILEKTIEMARASACPGEWPNYKGNTKQIVEEWPEYILDSEHALNMLTSDMPCSLFMVPDS